MKNKTEKLNTSNTINMHVIKQN